MVIERVMADVTGEKEVMRENWIVIGGTSRRKQVSLDFMPPGLSVTISEERNKTTVRVGEEEEEEEDQIFF